MKIVHIHQYYNDGLGYQENILPRYQAKLGHEVILITSNLSNGFDNNDRIKKIGEYEDSNFKVRRISINGEFKGRFVVFKNLYEQLDEIKPDYIFHHSVTSPSLGTVCNYKMNNPNVFLATDNHADLNISGRNKLWKFTYYNIFWKNYIRKLDKYIDVYFGVTPTRCLFLSEELGVNIDKIRLLPIGADTDKINFNVDRKRVLNKYGLNSEDFIIVHGGKITPEKQIDRILEAFSQIEEENIKLIIFGNIHDENVSRLISNDKRVINIGWLNREDTLEILSVSDIGIWNTQHTTLLEDAIAVGLPMIIRYYGSTSHLINNSGMFLYDGCVREIYDKLNFVIQNREILNSFKENAKVMSKRLSYDQIAYESIEYMKSLAPQDIHKIFMEKKYSDNSFKHFRILNRE